MILLSRLLCLMAFVAAAGACSNPSQAVDAPATAVDAPAAAAQGPGAEIRKFTGAPTRMVWVQGDGSDPAAGGDQLILMGLDTEDSKGERVILGNRQSYVKPLLTPGGDRILFRTRPQGTVQKCSS